MASRAGGYIRRNHLGLIAIFIALGGTTYAANKVGSNDIEKNAVRSKHIKAKQVKPGDLSPKAQDSCPNGSEKLGPICVRFEGTNLDWFTANDACAQRTLRLPSVAEANELASNQDVPGIGFAEKYWTDELDSTGTAQLGDEDTAGGSGAALLTGFHVICVTEPREGG